MGVQREMLRIFRFLGMPTCQITDTSRKNTRKYMPMATSEQVRLAAFYGQHNAELFELLSSPCLRPACIGLLYSKRTMAFKVDEVRVRRGVGSRDSSYLGSRIIPV